MPGFGAEAAGLAAGLEAAGFAGAVAVGLAGADAGWPAGLSFFNPSFSRILLNILISNPFTYVLLQCGGEWKIITILS
jgi:hypothetical protein